MKESNPLADTLSMYYIWAFLFGNNNKYVPQCLETNWRRL